MGKFLRAACGGQVMGGVAVARTRPCHCHTTHQGELRRGEDVENLPIALNK